MEKMLALLLLTFTIGWLLGEEIRHVLYGEPISESEPQFLKSGAMAVKGLPIAQVILADSIFLAGEFWFSMYQRAGNSQAPAQPFNRIAAFTMLRASY